jgi:NCS1 family nucleobase:cation symporter-1
MTSQGHSTESSATTSSETTSDKVFSIEQHGLEPIPAQHRHGQPRDLLWTWLGGAYNYVALAAGALPILFGLSLWQALLAVVIGNVLGAIVFGLCAIHGPRTATATIVNTRAALGHKGNLIAAGISFFSVSGWVAVNSVLASFALIQLLGVVGITLNTATTAVLVACVLIAQMAIAIYGHATVMATERVFAVASSILLTGLLVFVLPRVDWLQPAGTELAGSTTLGTWLLALGTMFAGPLSWANYASDYSRYLPEDTDWKQIALYSGLGMGIANVLGCTIGALLATLVDMSDPLANIPQLLPVWYLVLFLAAVLWGAVANNVLNLYTAGLGLLALRVHAPRWVAVLVIGIGASVLTYIAIFGYNFMDLYAQWLILTLSFLSPWVAILLVDFWLRRGRYNVIGLHTWGRGPYWFRNGINWSALGIYLLGIVAALAFSNSTVWASPLAVDYLGGADLSLFVGFLLTGTLYYLVESRRIRAAVRADAPASTEPSSAAADLAS